MTINNNQIQDLILALARCINHMHQTVPKNLPLDIYASTVKTAERDLIKACGSKEEAGKYLFMGESQFLYN